MKSFSKVIIGACFLLLGCKESFKGKIDVQEDIELVSRRGGDDTYLTLGQYDVNVEVRSEKKFDLIIRDSSQREQKVRIKLKNGAELPTHDGPFYFHHDQTDQHYDTSGEITSEISDGEEQWDWERCTYMRPYTVCFPHSCHTEYRQTYGLRRIHYFWRAETKFLNFEFLSVDDKNSLASFSGDRTSHFKVYLYEGICR